MRTIPRIFHPVALVALLSGCGFLGGLFPPADGDGCVLSLQQRDVVEEVVTKMLMDSLFVVEMTHANERAHALTLIGVDQGLYGIATVVEACTTVTEFEPFCDATFRPPGEEVELFWETRDRCGQLGCEAADVTIDRVYFTVIPHTDPEDRHVFSYRSEDYDSIVVYDPNPRVDWRIDQTDPGVLVVSADLSQGIIFTTNQGRTIDLTHLSSTRLARAADSEIPYGELELSFPALVVGDEPIAVTVTLDEDGAISGSVKLGDRTLSSMTASLELAPHFDWSGNCEEQPTNP